LNFDTVSLNFVCYRAFIIQTRKPYVNILYLAVEFVVMKRLWGCMFKSSWYAATK